MSILKGSEVLRLLMDSLVWVDALLILGALMAFYFAFNPKKGAETRFRKDNLIAAFILSALSLALLWVILQ